MRVVTASASPNSGGGRSRGTAAVDRGLRILRTTSAPERLAAALLILILYAAFAHGAVTSPDEPRLQVAVAGIAAMAGAVWLWSGSLRTAAPALGWIGAGLLAAFAVWSAVSLAWSVYPDGTWLEFNRYVTYTLVLLLAIIVGASARKATELLLGGYLAAALLVCTYALGQKLLPGLRVPGLIDLNQTGSVPRLQQPLGYWNALGLFLSMAVPLALAVVIDRSRTAKLRLRALVALQLLFLAIGLTYSRGGLVALGLGVLAAIALSGARLRGLMWIATAALGAVVPLILGLASHTLTTPNVSLSQREGTGLELLVVLIVFAAGLVVVGRRLQRLEREVTIGPARARAIGRGLVAAVSLMLVIAVLVVTFSDRGLTGTVSHAWHNFTATRGLSNTDPKRLLSADAGNRWVWWKEAVGAFSDRPIQGWGAGSFPVVHLLYRRNTLSVKQPHSVPLQYLAETGLIGAVLAIGAFVALLVAGARTVRGRPDSRERLVAAALFGAALGYGVHACYDWDTDIPGVTLPALMMLGVLLGSARGRAGQGLADGQFAYLPGAASPRQILTPGPSLRLLGIIALTITMSAFALSATLPSLAQTKASRALISAADGSSRGLQQADQQAALSAELDPLSDTGLRLESTIALRQGQFARARVLLVDALRRDPSDAQAWSALIYVELLFGDRRAASEAAQRVLQLDPRGEQRNILSAGGPAQTATLRLAKPRDSVSAIQTPESSPAAVP